MRAGFQGDSAGKEGTVMSRGFTSMFANDLNHLIDLKISLGYSENTYLGRARQFDRYCATKYAETGDLT